MTTNNVFISLIFYYKPNYLQILSAAHCIWESWLIRWLPLDAVAGAHDVNYFDQHVQISTITKRIAHPKYLGY